LSLPRPPRSRTDPETPSPSSIAPTLTALPPPILPVSKIQLSGRHLNEKWDDNGNQQAEDQQQNWRSTIHRDDPYSYSFETDHEVKHQPPFYFHPNTRRSRTFASLSLGKLAANFTWSQLNSKNCLR
jgi:hypothetical protein